MSETPPAPLGALLPSSRAPEPPAQVSSSDSTPSQAALAARLGPKERRILYFLAEGRSKRWVAKKYGMTPAGVDAVAASPAAAAFVDLQFGGNDLKAILLHKKALRRLEEQMDLGGANPTLDEWKLRDRAVAKVLEIRDRYRPAKTGKGGAGAIRDLHQTYVAAGGQVVQQAD